jgi:hypothetical protein
VGERVKGQNHTYINGDADSLGLIHDIQYGGDDDDGG